jgi:hypothetical protein
MNGMVCRAVIVPMIPVITQPIHVLIAVLLMDGMANLAAIAPTRLAAASNVPQSLSLIVPLLELMTSILTRIRSDPLTFQTTRV